MNKIEKAKEMFRELEERGSGYVAEIARRNFHIQDKMSAIN